MVIAANTEKVIKRAHYRELAFDYKHMANQLIKKSNKQTFMMAIFPCKQVFGG